MSDWTRWAMYVDGYNFYYAIRNRPEQTPLYLGWCHLGSLAREIISDRGSLQLIKYFTAPVAEFGKSGGELGRESARQAVWLRAVRTIAEGEVVEGFYSGDQSLDPLKRPQTRSEKKTDVNIAISLVLDAKDDLFDRAILVSGDYDQMPTVHTVTTTLNRHVEVWFPPNHRRGRWSEFRDNPRVTLHSITRTMLERCRLPEGLRDETGPVDPPGIWQEPP